MVDRHAAWGRTAASVWTLDPNTHAQMQRTYLIQHTHTKKAKSLFDLPCLPIQLVRGTKDEREIELACLVCSLSWSLYLSLALLLSLAHLSPSHRRRVAPASDVPVSTCLYSLICPQLHSSVLLDINTDDISPQNCVDRFKT